MISINDVKCEYILKQGNDLVDCTEHIKTAWANMTKEEKEGWYTTKIEYLRVKADDLIECFVDLINEEAYSNDFCEKTTKSVTNQQKQKLQEALDDITNNPEFMVYREMKLIDPNSKVVK